MSLLTLLEAAKYLDYRAEAQARGEEPHDYNTYASHLPPEMSPNSTNNSCASQSTSPVRMERVKEKTVAFGINKHVQSEERSEDRAEDRAEERGEERSEDRGEDDSGATVADSEWGESWLRLGTREVHNRLEKNRRAHLKECFETLKKQLPNMEDKKTSNLSILRSALRYIQTLKRKQRDYEHEMEKLARDKILQQQRLACLKKELLIPGDDFDISEQDIDVETLSTSTASETGPLSDLDEEMSENVVESSNDVLDVVPVNCVAVKSNKTLTNAQITSTTLLADTNQLTVQVPSIPALPVQTITVSKATGATITVNSLVNSLASQMGIHMNGGTNVISHPATVQVITPQSVRVISAAPTGLPVLNTATNVSSTFAAAVNVMTPRMTAIAAVTGTAQKARMTLAKPNVLPVTVAAKGVVGPMMSNAIAVKAIPTTLTTLTRGITLHTTCSAPGSAQGMIQVTNSNKPVHHVLQSQICTPRAVIPQAHGNIMSAHLNNVVRQVMAVRPGSQMRTAPLATQITHVVQPAPGHLVTSANHVSTMIAPINMVNHAATMAQVIAAQPSLAKVTAAPQMLKSVGQNPFLPTAHAQPLVKPVVVVSTSNVVMANGSLTPSMSHPT